MGIYGSINHTGCAVPLMCVFCPPYSDDMGWVSQLMEVPYMWVGLALRNHPWDDSVLVGGDWNHGILWLSIHRECHHPIWLSYIYIRGDQRGRYTHQPGVTFKPNWKYGPFWMNSRDLTLTLLELWLGSGIIPKWPYFSYFQVGKRLFFIQIVLYFQDMQVCLKNMIFHCTVSPNWWFSWSYVC